MFTGLVEGLGTVVQCETRGPAARLTIDAGALGAGGLGGGAPGGAGPPDDRVDIGDSVAVNGCCLTVVACAGSQWAFDAGRETLARTNLGRLEAGHKVNLERSLRWSDRLGGHLVTGHIDGVGHVDQRRDESEWSFFWFRCAPELTRQMAGKGSVAVDGVSLTLVEVHEDRFSVALIPHTLQVTTLGGRQVGDTVNLETDLLAKYVERQLAGKRESP